MRMLKKVLAGILAIGLLAGCSSQSAPKENEKATETTAQEQTETNQPKSKFAFPNEATPVGKAKLTLTALPGDPGNGPIPVFTVAPNEIIQVGVDLKNFQADKKTFLYIDKVFSASEQGGPLRQTSLTLQDQTLKAGKHTITAVQFKNDNPASKIVNLVDVKYKVKEAK